MPIIETEPNRNGFVGGPAVQVDSTLVDWSGSGWHVYSECPGGGTWCCEDSEGEDAEDKVLGTPGQTVSFKPFNIYQTAQCLTAVGSDIGMTQAAANNWLSTNTGGWISAALENGVGGNLALQDLPDLTPAGGPVNIKVAIATLIQNRAADGLFDNPTIHAPSSAVVAEPLWFAQQAGINVVFGEGYGITTGATPDGGWLYVTGRVEYSILEQREDIRRYMAGRTLHEQMRNAREAYAENMAVYRFDPCGGYKIQYTLCGGC